MHTICCKSIKIGIIDKIKAVVFSAESGNERMNKQGRVVKGNEGGKKKRKISIRDKQGALSILVFFISLKTSETFMAKC